MEQQTLEEDACCQVVEVFADGQHRGHEDVAALNHQVRNGIVEHRPQKVFPALVDVDQVAGDEQETWHVESVDYLFGIGMSVTDIDQMEADHENDQEALQEVKLIDSLHSCCRLKESRSIVVQRYVF